MDKLEKKPATRQTIYDRFCNEKILPPAILLLAALLRLIALGSAPAGVHQDEVFSIWNASSVLHYGIDSAGNFMPVYFADWGDGLSILYGYLLMPFLALSGGTFSLFLCRLPQVIVAVLTVWAVYGIFQRMFGFHAALWCEFLLAVCPWHITMSRWGLDANLAPGFLIFALFFFILALENNSYLPLSAFMYGLCLYCYAIMWLVVPVILLVQVVYAVKHGRIKLNRFAVLSALILFVTALPLMTFVLINSLELEPIRLPFMTIPVMSGYRGGEIGITARQIWDNIKVTGHLLIFQNTGAPYDVLLPYGLFYDIGRLFIVIGGICLIWNLVRKMRAGQFCFEFLIFAQLIGAAANCLMVTAKLHQVNSLYIPLVFCEAYGIRSVILLLKARKKSPVLPQAVIAGIYLICLVLFQKDYYTSYMELANAYFGQGIQECVEFSMETSRQMGESTGTNPPIIAERGLQWPRLLLFSDVTAPEYLSNVVYTENHVEPESFRTGGITFINGIDYDHINPDAVYIIYFTDEKLFRKNYTLTKFYDWYVAVPKGE